MKKLFLFLLVFCLLPLTAWANPGITWGTVNYWKATITSGDIYRDITVKLSRPLSGSVTVRIIASGDATHMDAGQARLCQGTIGSGNYERFLASGNAPCGPLYTLTGTDLTNRDLTFSRDRLQKPFA